MWLLANENIPLSAVGALRACGHDVLWIREKAPGSTDIEVMALGHREERILITSDKDFGELAFCTKQPPARGIILFRVPMISSAYIAKALVKVIGSRDDWEGHFAVVEEDRIRIKPLKRD
jgi:predicted nuclease of predicted toxin-antitoxin system